MSTSVHNLAPHERRREQWEAVDGDEATAVDRTDADLLRAVRAGDIEAFAALVHRYRDSHARFVRCMLGDEGGVERTLQAAFVRAFLALDRGPEPLAFGVWLHDIVTFECTLAAEREGEAMLAADPALARLRDMSLADREAFVLHFVEELTVDEMQGLTGIDAATIRERLERVADAAPLASSLRERPLLDAGFDARVMGAVRAEAHARGSLRSRWAADPVFALVQRRSAEIDQSESAPTPLGLLAFVVVMTTSLSLILIAAASRL